MKRFGLNTLRSVSILHRAGEMVLGEELVVSIRLCFVIPDAIRQGMLRAISFSTKRTMGCNGTLTELVLFFECTKPFSWSCRITLTLLFRASNISFQNSRSSRARRPSIPVHRSSEAGRRDLHPLTRLVQRNPWDQAGSSDLLLYMLHLVAAQMSFRGLE